MADQTLLLLLDEVRGKTLRLLEAVTDDDQARWAPEGLSNSILWHAGHVYTVVETLTIAALGQTPQIPEGWHAWFSWESRPTTQDRAQWPPLDEVRAHLASQRDRLHAVIAAISPEQLDQPSQRNLDRSVRYSILHGLHDEACHCGEIWLLRKHQGANRA